MAELPTREELEQLDHEKGHDALVWYAWRCALRFSPVLGGISLKKAWPENTVSHIYAVCRSYMVLSQQREISKRIITSVGIAADKARIAATNNSKSNFRAVADISAASYLASFAVASAAREWRLADVYSRASRVELIIKGDATSKQDYSFIQQQAIFDKNLWASRPLWLKKKSKRFSEPTQFHRYRLQLIKQLESFGMDFLAQDLQCLWKMQPLGKHALNYFENLSDTITNDPAALREAILGSKDAAETLQSVRVLLLGPGGAGKSSLGDRLLGKPVTASLRREVTIGVEYAWLDNNILSDINPELELDKKLDLRLWDFGGQTIFHGLHRAFLHENCVYVLVVDSRHEQAPDEWLYQIRDLTKNNPQVLIVTNRYDRCDTCQNETRLLREFPDLLSSPDQFFYFSCHQTGEAQFKQFIQTLVNQSMNSRHQVLKLAMDVQRKMKVEFKDQVFLEEERIEELIPEHLVEKFHGTVINHLDQLGYMIPVEEGETTYCLKPEWAIKHAYDLVHSPELQDVNGIAPKSALQKIFKGKIETNEINFLIQFLRSRHLCQKLKNSQYFFPDSTPTNEPAVVHELEGTKGKLELRFDLPFLPLGVHTRFIDELFHTKGNISIPDTKAIWRQGFLLYSDGAKASVQYQWRKSCIEITMAGDVEGFADLLSAFHNALLAVLKEGCLRETDVQPYVVYGGGQVYSIHSSVALADKLRKITHIDQLFPKVQAMAAEKVINIGDKGTYIESAESSQIATNSKHFTQNNQPQTLSVNEQKTLQDIVKALRDNLDSFETEQQIAVLQTQQALESPQDEKSAHLLSKAYAGLLKNVDGLATFTKDKAIPITDFAIKNKESLVAAATALTVAIGT